MSALLYTGHHSFELTTFDKPSFCDVCHKLLHGCYFQGYMCSGEFSTHTVHMEVQEVYLPQQYLSLGEAHPRPAQALPTYIMQKAEPPRCLPSLENWGWYTLAWKSLLLI